MTMELLIAFGSIVGGIILYIVLGFTKLSNYRPLIVAIALLINLVGLLKLQSFQEPSLLGSSDFITGRIGSCEKTLGVAKCYEEVEYRGFPFRAIRTTFKEKNGEVTKHHFFSSALLHGGSPKGGGFILNIILYGTAVSALFYFFQKQSLK